MAPLHFIRVLLTSIMARKEKLTFNKDIRSEVKHKVHTAAAEIPNMYPKVLEVEFL